jgi:excinuclease UvrABC nuclease subunit
MQKSDLQKSNLPDQPGVYLFYKGSGKAKRILYVGKATSLKDRVRSYFDDDVIATRGPRIVDMITVAQGVDYEITPTVLEALVREAALIKQYRPKANALGLDDKSFLHCIITDEDIPRVLLVRGKDIDKEHKMTPYGPYKHLFGPFPSGLQIKEALRIIRKIFPFYDTPKPYATRTKSKHTRAKIEFDTQIGKSPSEKELVHYNKMIHRVALFISGKTKELRALLKKEMEYYAKTMQFEEAGKRKKELFALDHLKDVSMIKKDTEEHSHIRRVEAFDVAHLSGTNAVGVMVVFEAGEKSPKEYRTFTIKGIKKNDDIASLREILTRRFAHEEWPFPTAIVIDGGKTHKLHARQVLAELSLPITVVAVVKNEKHQAREVLNAPGKDALPLSLAVSANAEAHRFAVHTHRKKRAKMP